MRIFLFFILTCSGSFALSNNVRVLLDQSPQTPAFAFLGPAEFATTTQKISIYESNFKTQIVQHKKGWVLQITTKHFSEKYYLKGEKLTISSLAVIEWQQQSIDFRIQLARLENQYLVIGEMSMDRYLSGVVPREMPASWPKEALKAQV
ncbi:SpoIID/LytB domain-containing protein, partial [bacterium]|nr:SpoIID/LytB domain-containing protein [bacterium]